MGVIMCHASDLAVHRQRCARHGFVGMVRHLLILLLAVHVTGHAEESTGQSSDGARTYLTYCAGCHGFDGRAQYQHAPSFSLGERLKKNDRVLLQSVLNGRNNMPPWKDKLPVRDLRSAISYLRLMYARHEKGEKPLQDELPPVYYLFKPVGEKDMEWVKEEVAR